MLLLLILTGLLFEASMSQITSHGNKTADYGKDAYYSCKIENPAGVLQVTWQRLFRDDSIENLATFSKRFGEQVNQPYVGKIVFTEASLSSTSITVKNVTWEDEACYICSFNVYPEGSQRKQICPTVEGISEEETKDLSPSREQKEFEEEVEIVVGCSATGKPAPTIQWTFPSDATRLDKPETAVTANGDRTFTSSSNITLQVPSDWNGHVDCVLNEGVMGHQVKSFPFSFGGDENDGEKVVKQLSKSGIALVISLTLFIIFIVVAIALKRQRLKRNKRNGNVLSVTCHNPVLSLGP